MAVNVSGLVDNDLFLTVNTAVHLTLFCLLTLPTFILTGVCVVSLLLARAINLQMRIVLANVLIAETCYSVRSCFQYLGYPLRAWNGNEDDISCDISFSILLVYAGASLSSTAICAFMINRFIQYGKEKFNWSVIVGLLCASWSISIALGAPPYFKHPLSASFGFCVPRGENNITTGITVPVFIAVGILSCFCIVLVYSILTYRHARRNAPRHNVKVKRAVLKILAFHTIKMCVLLIQYSCSVIASTIQQQYVTKHRCFGTVLIVLITYLVSRISFDITALSTPIISIVILKPVLDSLKNASEMMSFFCNKCKVKIQIAKFNGVTDDVVIAAQVESIDEV